MSGLPVDLEAALGLVQRGDREAFATIYDELAPAVYGVVRRVVRDDSMSEEVTQEVFVEVWRSAANFDRGRGSVSTWVVTMARRRAIDRVRSEQRHRDRVERVAARDVERPGDLGEAVVDTIEAQRVRRAVASLPEDQREVIELAFIGGMAHGAIAEQLDLPLGTVKGRVRGGLRRLRQALRVDDGR